MKRKYPILFTFFSFFLLAMGFQCNKDLVAPEPVHEYAEKLSLSPYKKIYSINDTIWLQFQTTNKALFDKRTGTQIRTDTTYLQAIFHLFRRYPAGAAVEFFSEVKTDSVQDLSFTPLYTYYNTLSFKTSCSSSRYFFRAGFILKKTGIYSLEPNGSLAACAGKYNLPYTTFRFTFDLPDCNKDIWLSIPVQSRGGETGFTDRRIDEKEIFLFKVE
jgi:hypothetical protein